MTRNSADFHGPAERPGAKGRYEDVALHAGPVCLNGPPGMDLGMQVELFEQARNELEADADLLHQVLEITWAEDALAVRRHRLPDID